jgi:hypothetical protein
VSRRIYWIVECRAKGTRGWHFDSVFTTCRDAEAYAEKAPVWDDSFVYRVTEYRPVWP